MRCQFCGETLEDASALQVHQVVSCPAVQQEDYDGTRSEQETANVQFKWLVDRVVSEPVIYLIGSDLMDNIELKKGNACFKSGTVAINTGKYSAQMIIGDDIVPVAEFEIDLLSDIIYLIAEKDSTADDISESSPIEIVSPCQPSNTSPQSHRTPTSDDMQGGPQLSALHKELIEHQVRHPDANLENLLHEGNFDPSSNIGNFLSEENFASSSDHGRDASVRPRIQDFRSPEDPTMRNIEDLTHDYSPSRDHFSHDQSPGREHFPQDISLIRDHFPQENQQPVESEAEESLIEVPVIVSPRIPRDQEINTNSPRFNQSHISREHSVDEILNALSMTDQEDTNTSRQHSNPSETEEVALLRLPQVPSEPSFQSNNLGDMIQGEIEDAMMEYHNSSSNGDNRRESNTDNRRVSDDLQGQIHAERFNDFSESNEAARMSGNGSRINSRSGSADGYASDVSSQAAAVEVQRASDQVNERLLRRENSREGTVRRSSRRARNHSYSSQHSQDNQHQMDDVNKDNIIAELKVKCESCESEINRLNKEVNQLKDSTENYREVKAELETKYNSYNEENARIKQEFVLQKEQHENEELNHAQVISELQQVQQQLEDEKQQLQARCQLHDAEVEIMNRDYEELVEKYETDAAMRGQDEDSKNCGLITDLEAKCQSYDTELERLKQENQSMRQKYGAFDDIHKNINTLEIKCEKFQVENQKLTDENQSLEAAQKLHEEDVKNERDRLEAEINVLRKANTELRLASYERENNGEISPNNDARVNIDKLKHDNKILKYKLHNIRAESEVTDHKSEKPPTNHKMEEFPRSCDRTSPQSNSYHPHILSPRLMNSYGNSRITDQYSSRYLKTSSSLPNRFEHSLVSHGDEDSGGSASRISPAKYEPRNYSNSNHLLDSSPPDVGSNYTSLPRERFLRSSSNDYIDSVMKRYSSGSSDSRSSRDILSKSPSRRPRSFHDDITGILDSNYSSTLSKSSRYHPKARSLDLRLDEVGLREEPSLSRHTKYNSITRIPFCPTSARDLAIGMKVSVNRTSGRLSRGTVKWIGTLPSHYGDYVGMELETETGKHDGYFDGVQYFKCKHSRGVFVKFPKVIMAWK